MAARTRKVRIDEFTRERIKVSQLINVLEKQALSGGSMEPTQLRAIEILLKKSLPDLTNVNHTGGTDNTHTVKWEE